MNLCSKFRGNRRCIRIENLNSKRMLARFSTAKPNTNCNRTMWNSGGKLTCANSVKSADNVLLSGAFVCEIAEGKQFYVQLSCGDMVGDSKLPNA